MKKKYYVWYSEGLFQPERLATFYDKDDYIDFIGITCSNRCYDIEDMSIEEINDDDELTGKDRKRDEQLGATFRLATIDSLKAACDFAYNRYHELEEKYQSSTKGEDGVRRAAAWKIYERLEKELTDYVK